MNMYKCGKCGEKFASLGEGSVRCPVCANKVVYKMREPVVKEVKAR